MYAVIKTGGKQYKVAKGSGVFVEKFDVEAGEKITSDRAVLVSDGKDVKVGTLPAEGTGVVTTIKEQGKKKKVVTFKYKPKEHLHSKYGHRQPYARVTTESIEA